MEEIKTNILFLINYAGKAGIERYVENLVRIFSGAGEHCFFAYNIPGELSEKMAAQGIPSLRLNMEKTHLRSAAKILAAYCRENDIDVIHPQCPRENIIALMSRKHYPVPRVVYTCHFTTRTGTLWRHINRRFTPRNDKIIAVCNEGRDIMIENGVCAERIQVIFNGVEPAPPAPRDTAMRTELGIAEDSFVMSILARYEPEKGLPFLLDSLSRLRELTDRRFHCLICGDGSEFSLIRDKIAELGLEDTVLQLGFRSDTPRILHASDLYLNTSPCNEAMSFAILEAMNAGLPSVVTDVGGNRDLAETNTVCGIVVDYGDTEAFARAILRLMEDDGLREQYAAAARRKVAEAFDLNKLAMDVLAAYHS